MIYCVEDESGIRNMMVYTLESAGLKAKGLEDGAALYAALKEEIPSLIILDIMLPDEDGISILKKLRVQSSTQRVPVIMATAKGSEYDKVIGLDSGADDYLVKPFGMMEMVSRVRAVMRRSAQEEVPAIQLGQLYLNPSAHVVMVDGEPVELTYKEFEMLYMLMSNPGRVFTRQQFLTCIWDQDYDGETRTVDVHIRNLRQKLGPCGNYINTVRGVGYRMEVSE
ncbi:MAG: response regulator transcription factor [Peptococcaceae bacterium]|nr:response regulator transcription factor [Peptococcaceae bacterium]MEE0207552.1 response regulator transcription factor [Peptococcaceae bacterium]